MLHRQAQEQVGEHRHRAPAEPAAQQDLGADPRWPFPVPFVGAVPIPFVLARRPTPLGPGPRRRLTGRTVPTEMTTPPEPTCYRRVDAVQPIDRGLEARLHGERLRIELVDAGIVRLAISRDGAFEAQPTRAVCVDPLSRPAPPFRVEHSEGSVRLVTDRIVVSLGMDPFRIDVRRADGSAVIEPATDADGVAWTYATSGGGFALRRRAGPDDAVFGLGEKSGPHNRRGRDFTLWNLDVLNPNENAEFRSRWDPDHPRADRTSVEFDPYYVSVPFFYHQSARDSTMVGSFIDNPFRAHYDFIDPHELRVAFDGGQYVEYVFAGPDMTDILADFTWLTGRAAPPPLWALGYHQCRWHRYSQAEFEALAARFRAERIPCDGLWLDIEHMDGYRVFTWDHALFPDAPGMLQRLGDQGFRVISIVDPGVKRDPGYPVFDDGLARELFCRTADGEVYIGQVWPGETAFPDFATEAARTWWGELNAAHVASGLAGIWNDMNEPATGRVPATGMRFDHGRAPHERFHNQYALLMAMGTREGLLAARPDLRTFILSRAGSAGIQRYAANWLGDNQSRWDHLWLSIGMGAGLGVSGQPFVGADVGGFMGDTDAELLVRWTQYGALTPFFRNHAMIGTVEQYPWSFGEQAQQRIAEAIRLRYRLLPYLYASFLRACATGEPVQRPLVLDHQDEPAVRDVDDQYLLGRDLLVAPVVAPGTTERSVVLPSGGWYDWHTGQHVGASRTLLAPAPPDRIPVYARAGAVIPMWPQAPDSTAGYQPELVELHLFVPEDATSRVSTLVEDDGLTLAGDRLTTTFVAAREGARVRLTATTEGRACPQSRRRAFRLHVHGGRIASCAVAGAAHPHADDAVQLPNDGHGLDLDIELLPA
jgi:alpha-glucosidase